MIERKYEVVLWSFFSSKFYCWLHIKNKSENKKILKSLECLLLSLSSEIYVLFNVKFSAYFSSAHWALLHLLSTPWACHNMFTGQKNYLSGLWKAYWTVYVKNMFLFAFCVALYINLKEYTKTECHDR